MVVYGISTDPPEASAKFAAKYAIDFPLLADVDGAVSKQYVGVNHDDTTIPGVVLVKKDGTIGFRQIAGAKDDRLTTPQLFDAMDRTFGTTGADANTDYGVLERWQVHLDAGGGHDGVRGAIAQADLAVLAPLARELAAGPWVASDLAHALDTDLAAAIRAPILHDVAAIQLTVTGGYSPYGGDGQHWNLGARLGTWLAWTPSWAVTLDVAAVTHGPSDRAVFVTLGGASLVAP